MRGGRRFYNAISNGVRGMTSLLITCAIGACFSTALSVGLWVVMLCVVCVLATGLGETVAVRLLARARAPRTDELASLQLAVAVLEEFDLTPSQVCLLVRGWQDAIWAGATGRRTVVVSRGMAAAIPDGRARPDEVAALLAHGIGRIRLGQTKYSVALAFLQLPWRAVQSGGRMVGRVVVRFPLVVLAWRLRVFAGVVAVIQGGNQGHALSGVLSAVVVVLSYAAPWAAQHAELAAEVEADRFVVAVGLGGALSRFLERDRTTPRIVQRVHQLQDPRTTAQHLAFKP